MIYLYIYIYIGRKKRVIIRITESLIFHLQNSIGYDPIEILKQKSHLPWFVMNVYVVYTLWELMRNHFVILKQTWIRGALLRGSIAYIISRKIVFRYPGNFDTCRCANAIVDFARIIVSCNGKTYENLSLKKNITQFERIARWKREWKCEIREVSFVFLNHLISFILLIYYQFTNNFRVFLYAFFTI
jgi:hypothetical protein